MSDREDLKNPEHVQKVIDEMLKQASPMGDILTPGGANDPMKVMGEVAAQLEQSMMEMYKGIHKLSQGLDISRLQNHMVLNILVDKGIVTKEEVETRYKKDVEDEMQKMRKKIEEKMNEQIQAAVDQQTDKKE